MIFSARCLLTLLLLALASPACRAYSLLTHEALIDASWAATLEPAIKNRFPAVADSELQACRAYAYGGAVLPDMGYFPMGNRDFSDLLHYVRNGDFVVAMLEEARNSREYAFALGTLAHYHADRYGHPLGVNPSVAMLFPKKAQDGCALLTYEDAPSAHTRTEFGFDVLQVARGNYASEVYQHFIEFETADSLLYRAFYRNYGIAVDSLFKNYGRSVRTFRWTVRDVIPQLTREAWRSRRHRIQEQNPTATARQFHYRMRRSRFYRAYGRDFDRPGIGARLTAALLQALPKVGPLKVLKPVIPTEAAEKLFIHSFDTVVACYRATAARMPGPLENVDWDTGEPTAFGEYHLADKAYTDLLLRLQRSQWASTSPALRQHLVGYFDHRPQHEAVAPDTAVIAALAELRRGKATSRLGLPAGTAEN